MYFVTNMLACAPVPPLAGLTCDRSTAYSEWVGQSAGLADAHPVSVSHAGPADYSGNAAPQRMLSQCGAAWTGEPPPSRRPADTGTGPGHSAVTGRPSGREGRCWTCTRWRPSARPVQTAVRWESRPATWIWTVMRGGTGGVEALDPVP